MNRLRTVLAITACAALLVTGCTKVVDGKPITVAANPTEIAGKPVTEGPSGLRPNAPGPKRPVVNGDGGPIDNLAATSIDDIEQFWTEQYRAPFKGKFIPVDALFSWDSTSKENGVFCDETTTDNSNAAFCPFDGHSCATSDKASCTGSYNTIGWDRGVYLADRQGAYGDMGVALTLGHEYGHAIQRVSAKLIAGHSPAERLEAEQQADCFGGAYIRWVVNGKSPRFTLSTGDALSKVIATRIVVRDPLLSSEDPEAKGDLLIHGSAFERVSAFLFGFNDGVFACASIDPEEIVQRRGDLPKDLLGEGQTGEYAINEQSVTNVIEALSKAFPLADPPKLSFDATPCADAKPTPPASYCAATNTIAVDMNRLILMGTSLTRGSPLDVRASLIGDYSAYSIVVSRYMLAVQKGRGGLVLDNENTGLRTACLTGVATAKFAPGITLANGGVIKIYGGDLDEALSGVLTNGMAASNVNGAHAPSGIARVDAFRSGVLGDDANCYRTWP